MIHLIGDVRRTVVDEHRGHDSMAKTWWRRRGQGRVQSVHVPLRSLGVAATCVITLALAAPLVAASPRTEHATPTPPFGVGVARCTFVDHSRSLLNYSTTPFRVLSTSRKLVTEIRYPVLATAGGTRDAGGELPIARSGGYPTIVFAHGYDVTPDTYAALLDAWVRAGFVVVAPIFPDESASAVGNQPGTDTEDDLANEPGDLAFVTRSMIAASEGDVTQCPIARNLLDPSRIALAGHSDGAVAVGMLAYDHGVDPQGVNYATLRSGLLYRAVIILSGAADTNQSYATEAGRPDLLVVQSLLDQCNPFLDGLHLYDSIHQPNKWFLELQTAHHLPPFDGVDKSAFLVASRTTIRFLQIALEGPSSSSSLWTLGNLRPSIARIYEGNDGPSVNDLPKVEEHCGPN